MNKGKLMRFVLDDLYSRLAQYSDKEPYSTAKKYFIDAAMSFDLICSNYLDILELKDRLSLEQTYIDICDSLNRWDYGCFFYRMEHILSDIEKLEFKLREGQFDCLSMSSCLISFKNNYSSVNRSLLDSFLTRSPNYAASCLTIIKSDDFDDKTKELAIYGLIAVINAHISYLGSGYNFYIYQTENDYNPKLKEKSRKYITSWCNELYKIVEMGENGPYNDYAKVILNKSIEFGFKIKEQEISKISKNDLNHDLWTAINLLRNQNEVPKDLIKCIYKNIGNSIPWYIRSRIPLALFLIGELDNDYKFNLTPSIGSIDINSVLNYVFPTINLLPKNDNIDKETLIADEWKDDALQKAICEIIKSSPNITDEEKLQLDYESWKKDSGYEIADIVLSINIDGTNIAVCMPLKTGKEVGKTTPNLPSKMVIHQILRPFQHYKNNGCVILISIRNSSQDLANMIQKARIDWNWPIIRLEGRKLISLLKYHKYL